MELYEKYEAELAEIANTNWELVFEIADCEDGIDLFKDQISFHERQIKNGFNVRINLTAVRQMKARLNQEMTRKREMESRNELLGEKALYLCRKLGEL